jgi:hypothetical protein
MEKHNFYWENPLLMGKSILENLFLPIEKNARSSRRYSPRLQRDLGSVQRLAPKGEGFGSVQQLRKNRCSWGKTRGKAGEKWKNQGKPHGKPGEKP